MSVLWTLRKFVDSIQHREDEARHRLHLQVAPRRVAGAGTPPPAARAAAPPGPRVCRVCGYRAPGALFCPACLAETMIDDPRGGV